MSLHRFLNRSGFAQYQGRHFEEVLVKALADQNEQLGYEHGLFRELGKPKQILHVRILLDSLDSLISSFYRYLPAKILTC